MSETKKIWISIVVIVCLSILGIQIKERRYEKRQEEKIAKRIESVYRHNRPLNDLEMQGLCDMAEELENRKSARAFIYGYISREKDQKEVAKEYWEEVIRTKDKGTPRFMEIYAYKFLAEQFIEEKAYPEAIRCIDEVASSFTIKEYNQNFKMVWELLSTLRKVPNETGRLSGYIRGIIGKPHLGDRATVFFNRKFSAMEILEERYFDAITAIIEVLNVPDSKELDYYKAKSKVDLAIIAKNFNSSEQAIMILESIEENIENEQKQADLGVYKYINLAQNQTILERYEEALISLEKAEQYIDKLPEPKQKEAELLLSTKKTQIYMDQDAYDQAKVLLEKLGVEEVMALGYSYPGVQIDVLKILGEIYFVEGKYEEARKIYEIIVAGRDLGTDLEDYRDALIGLIYVNKALGDETKFNKAIEQYKCMQEGVKNSQFATTYEYIKGQSYIMKAQTYSKEVGVKNTIYLICLCITIYIVIKLNVLPWLVMRKTRKKIKKHIKNHHYFLVYQPIINPKKSQIIGFEALLRLKDKEKVIYPNSFIPQIHKAKMMGEIALWEIREISQNYELIEALPFNMDKESFYISINVSFEELQDKDFIRKIISETTELFEKGARICLEITENIGVEEKAGIQEHMDELIQTGFKIAIDDFGVEYSNIALLDQVDFHTLKLDKHFIDHIEESIVVQNLLKVINELSKALNIHIVIEGVEEDWQKEMIKSYDSETFYIQGYYYSKPLTIEELRESIKHIPKHQL
ncbi:MAG: EAL domain-containing protein [Cellulosilyticaceae bacterium]